MKKNLHPEYNDVVFWDMTSDVKFMSRSTAKPKDTIEFEGKTHPVIKIEVSSYSHPFYTGKNIQLDSTGRVEKFNQRFAKKAVVKK